jgi:DNA-binding response OmpR family regulator
MDTDAEFDVLDAATGAAAHELLKTQPVDCVLIDNKMPGGDGLDWLAKIMGMQEYLAVIMVTGAGSEEIAVTAMKHGAMDYLVKGSITAESLQRAILNAIEKTTMRRTIQAQQEELMEAERHRVMVESLGAACHHLGQPATVITTYVQMLKRQETEPSKIEMMDNCLEAIDELHEVLEKLHKVATYRTEPYRLAADGEPPRLDERILSL